MIIVGPRSGTQPLVGQKVQATVGFAHTDSKLTEDPKIEHSAPREEYQKWKGSRYQLQSMLMHSSLRDNYHTTSEAVIQSTNP